MNLMTGFPIFLMGYVNIVFMKISFSDSPALFILYVIMMYLGISLLCNLFPLIEDALTLHEIVFSKGRTNIVAKIFMAIPSLITTAGAYLEKYCITLILWVVFIAVTFIA